MADSRTNKKPPRASTRASIAKLSRVAEGNLLSIPAAAKALGLDQKATAMRLANLARQGWLLRARRGLYFILPLEAEPGRPTVSEDPWLLAREAFSPCYIGGWSAAEHWGLTEQLFRSTLVITGASIRSTTSNLLGHEFRLFQVPRHRIAGALVPVWRGAERVLVSTPERTLADCLRHPALCGGVRHLVQLLREYGERKDHDFSKLGAAVTEAGSGAAWKRLGYLAESLWPRETHLLELARARLTTGNARLDPTIRRRGKLLRRWRLWVNVSAAKDAGASLT